MLARQSRTVKITRIYRCLFVLFQHNALKAVCRCKAGLPVVAVTTACERIASTGNKRVGKLLSNSDKNG
jgi:hypothetical protein